MNTRRINNHVPFDHSICTWLDLNRVDWPLLVQASHQYDSPYLAWQTVRKERNPFFVNGTGFEGYFVGTCATSDEALARLLAIGQSMLESIHALHPHGFRFRARLMKTLVGEDCDYETLYEWNAMFGAALARLHGQTMRDRQAAAFRDETYRLVDQQPDIQYQKHGSALEQEYYVPNAATGGEHRILVSEGALTRQDQDAWVVVQSIGRFGHPLVRMCLHRNLQEYGTPAA